MPFNLPVANKGGNAPKVNDGLQLLRFDDLLLKEHEDWAGTDKFGKADNGQRFHFQFTLFTPKGEVAYEDEGDPIELEATTRTATGEKSNFAAILGGILTPQEMAAWAVATEDQPFDGDAVKGRMVHGKIEHNKGGWPQVAAVIGIAEVGKPKTKAQLKAEAQALLDAADEADDGDETE